MRRIIWIAAIASCTHFGGGGGGGDDGGGGDGGGGPGSECLTELDCAEDLGCLGPNAHTVCGIAPREQCSSDATCSTGRCHAIADGCSPDDVGSECRDACTGDAECGAGFRCTGGACAAVLCDAGYTCPPQQVCDAARITSSTPIYDRNHGCFDITCIGDADCLGMTCVNTVCQTGPGTCQEVVAVP